MNQGEVSLRLALCRFWLLKGLGLSKMLIMQLVLESCVRSLGEHALLFKDGEDAHWLLNKLNAGSQVHTEVNELPDNALFLVLLLLQDKHVVVEELLQFLIGEVDAELLQAVEIKDLKSSDIQHSNEELSWLLCVQHLIDTDDHPQEHFLIDRLAQSHDRIVDLWDSLTFGHHLISDLDSRVTQSFQHIS